MMPKMGIMLRRMGDGFSSGIGAKTEIRRHVFRLRMSWQL